MGIYLNYIDWCSILISNIREDIKRRDKQYFETIQKLLNNATDKVRANEWKKICDESSDVKNEQIIDFFSLDLYLEHSHYLNSKNIRFKTNFLKYWKRVENFRDSLAHSNCTYKDENGEIHFISEELAKDRMIDILFVNRSLDLPILVNKIEDFTNFNCFPKLKKKEEKIYFVRMMIQVFVEQYQIKFKSKSDFLQILAFDAKKRDNLVSDILNIKKDFDKDRVIEQLESLYDQDKIQKIRATRNSFFHHDRVGTNLELTKGWIRDFCALLDIPINRLMEQYKQHQDDPFYNVI